MNRGGIDYAGLHCLEIVVLVYLTPVYASLQAFFEDMIELYTG